MKKWFLACGILVLSVLGFAQGDIPFITTAQYDSLSKNNQVFILVFTTSRYCPPCHAASAYLFPKLQEQYKTVDNVQVFQVNVDNPAEKDSNSLKARYGVRGTPSLVVLVNDSAQLFHEGFNSKKPEELLRQITDTVNKYK